MFLIFKRYLNLIHFCDYEWLTFLYFTSKFAAKDFSWIQENMVYTTGLPFGLVLADPWLIIALLLAYLLAYLGVPVADAMGLQILTRV